MDEQVDNFQSDELVDPKQQMKDKRGKTLPVLCVLSYISIGYTTVTALMSFVRGPLTVTELDEAKLAALSGIEDGTPQFLIDFIMDSLDYALIANEKMSMINTTSLLVSLVGFFGVYMMFKLKKSGYYMYILYSILPIVLQLTIFPGNMLAKGIAFFIGLFSVLFVILYGVQLKRME
jgi:hypothetical protein